MGHVQSEEGREQEEEEEELVAQVGIVSVVSLCRPSSITAAAGGGEADVRAEQRPLLLAAEGEEGSG